MVGLNGGLAMSYAKKKDQEYIKINNKMLVFDVIRNERPVSRAEIAKITEMSPTSVGRIVSELIKTGVVRETSLSSSGVGRKAIFLDIDAESILNIGVYLNKNFCNLALIDFDGNILAYENHDINVRDFSPDEVINKIGEYINKLITEQNADLSRIIGVGIGLPGIIDYKKGKVVLSAQLGWKNVSIADKISARTGLKTIIDNSLKLHALAETMYGSAIGSDIASFIDIGAGVGSALVINGQIYRGYNNIAGEIGHITVNPNGMLCECGKRGCLQTYMAEEALIKEVSKYKKINTIDDIFTAYKDSQGWAVETLDMAATYIVITINNIIGVYNPDTIILSGDLMEKHDEMKKLVELKLKKSCWAPFRGTYKIVYSKLKNDGVLIGAAALSLKKYMSFD